MMDDAFRASRHDPCPEQAPNTVSPTLIEIPFFKKENHGSYLRVARHGSSQSRGHRVRTLPLAGTLEEAPGRKKVKMQVRKGE